MLRSYNVERTSTCLRQAPWCQVNAVCARHTEANARRVSLQRPNQLPQAIAFARTIVAKGAITEYQRSGRIALSMAVTVCNVHHASPASNCTDHPTTARACLNASPGSVARNAAPLSSAGGQRTAWSAPTVMNWTHRVSVGQYTALARTVCHSMDQRARIEALRMRLMRLAGCLDAKIAIQATA